LISSMTTESLKGFNRKDGERTPSELYLDVSRLNKIKIDIDFFGSIVYNTGTRSVESDGHGHGNSPLAAVGDREAVGSRHSAQTLHQMPLYF
jgi:hypothetical protein